MLYGKEKSLFRAPMDEFIDSLIKEMTLEEKLGQLTQYSGKITDKEKLEEQLELVRKGKVGSFLNIWGVEFIKKFQEVAVEESRIGIPLIFGLDVIHGCKTIFPVPIAWACSFDPDAVKEASRISAIEATAFGINWTFAPMIDIALDPRWGRIVEGAGEDPYLGSVMAKAQVEGYQGEDLKDSTTLLACAKHFVAYGACEGGRDYNSAEVSIRTLYEVYLPPFLYAIKAGVGSIMSAFNDISGIPMSANKELLTNLLREKWNFDGFVVSDWRAIPELLNHGIAESRMEAGIKALYSGVDMDMEGGVFGNELFEAVREGKLSEDVVDKAVRRVLKAKYKLGLFDDPFKYCNLEREKLVPLNKEHIEKARELACKSIVLLKNEGNLLPLRKDIKRIAVIGPLANDASSPLGPWSALGEEKDVVTILEGIKGKVSKGTEVFYAPGCEIIGDSESGFEEAISIAKNSDVVILVLGESRDMSGEARSRSEITLPEIQRKLAERIIEIGKRVILVLSNGRPLAISSLSERVPAILETWFLGIQGGNAIADVLFGDYNPGGKLAVSIPRSTGQVPCFYYHKNTGRPASSEIVHSSRYFDLPITPLYPFGHGLSYTSFKYSKLKIKNKKVGIDDSLQISFLLKNTGKLFGSEVIQLYVRDPVASVAQPVKKLKGFKRVYLEAGEEVEIKIKLPVKLLSFYNIDMKKVVEPGVIELMIGSSSEDIRLRDSFTIIGNVREVDETSVYYCDIEVKKNKR